MKLPKSKRLRIAIGGLIGNFLIVVFAIWLKVDDILSLCKGLAFINTPLYIYILGDSFRPSGVTNTFNNNDTQ